ncbi:hypothetical protein [Actinosynnema sp. NPDC020468]|uniref:hypothetical protein n=1 Tax=Actinosynnema sp. NPDC020468 TaxID=3154488 RepID=UPI0033D1D0D5
MADRWRTINGNRVLIKGGGGKGGPVALACVVALGAAGAGGAGVVGAGGGAAGGGGSVSARKVEARKAAKGGDAEGAWRRLGMRESKKSARQQAECLAVTFGEVREFFLEHRCASVDRVLFAVGDGENAAIVSVAWVGLADRGDAVEFRSLVDRHGSGDVAPLGGPLLGYADIAFGGLNYGSERDGARVTVAEAETVVGHVDPEVLDAVAEVAALLPPL